MGYLLLAGGAEFGGRMAEPDRAALRAAGGVHARVGIVPAAAAPDNNHGQAGENGRRWFQGLGAERVTVLPIIDRTSANDADVANALSRCRLVYLLGGFPHYLARTLKKSDCLKAMMTALENGAVLAGSSAGAMVMCEYYYDPHTGQIEAGLDLLPNTLVLPHHDTFGHTWAIRLRRELPRTLFIGIDEQTGLLGRDAANPWRVLGAGKVTLYKSGETTYHEKHTSLCLPETSQLT